MEELNRIASPMHIFEEDLSEAYDVQLQKQVHLREQQRAKSPFIIGSIDDINRRIGRLDRRLKGVTTLLAQSPDNIPRYARPSSHQDGHKQMRRIQEVAEVTKFAGIYSVKATFGFNTSKRVQKIAKISTKKRSEVAPPAQKDTVNETPKFIELYQFPGFDAHEYTPLPENVSPILVLNKAMKAHPKKIMGPYKACFTRWFFSKLSQAMLQDIFWFYFVTHYGSKHDKLEKDNFFDRTSRNYSRLLLFCDVQRYRDVFLTDYPSLLSKALFAAFSDCFPDSYSQFGAEFKEELIRLVYDWLTGIQPANRLWQTWNMTELEPEEVKAKEAKKLRSGASATEHSGFEKRIAQLNSPTKETESSENGPQRKSVAFDISSSRRSTSATTSNSQSVNGGSNWLHGKVSTSEPLHDPSSTRENTILGSQAEAPLNLFENDAVKKESTPAGRGPDAVLLSFNTAGRSPLMQHHMRRRNMRMDDKGTDIFVRRTELRNLPALDSETYQDVIKKSSATIKQLSADFRIEFERNTRESNRFVRDQRAAMRVYQAKQEALLANRREVHRLSDYLVMESKREPNTVAYGVDAMVERSLMATEVKKPIAS